MTIDTRQSLNKIIPYLISVVVFPAIGGFLFLQISNRNLAKSIVSKYKPNIQTINDLENSGCQDIPDNWLNEYGELHRSDAILYCQKQFANGGGEKMKRIVIDTAKNEYLNELSNRGAVHAIANTVACVALYCPVQDIENLQKTE